jgi:hypothetical protein
MTKPSAMRPELTTLPLRMKKLPLDARGYPVPWFVQWMNKEGRIVSPSAAGAYPEFRVMDQVKWVAAIRDKRCWVCGEPMGTYKVFVVGPMCGINRTTSEPPCHLDCALWSAENCPFLARPKMVRRDNDGLAEQYKENVPGTMLERNPGVALLWTTKSFVVFQAPNGPLLTMGDPLNVRFFAHGRPATREEVLLSVIGGYPALHQMAEDQDRAEGGSACREALQMARERFERLLPAAL